ncbi:P-loop containing nucleoside triphosphate hydrolase protein [Mycena rebaudengoi]|nr:P-loop containing nucleoside triphosphate hydrolase protein [Mycena rebaudengoi]
MPHRLRWKDPIGRTTLRTIVKKVIPLWKDGLRPVQEDLVAPILDRDDILCLTATGDGKSAAFSVPILVLDEYNSNPHLYPAGLPTRIDPVGMIVTPTKGLATNIVHELDKLGISALSYSRETLADSHKERRDLTEEIKSCKKWRVICVDPDRLGEKEWREISEGAVFRARILYAAADEVHLINQWGIDFRIAFKVIGRYFRGRLPDSISVVGLSATLAPGPGKDTASVCESLGFFQGFFHLIRRTNERPNIRFTIQTPTHGLAGYKFPDVPQILASGRKASVHVHSLDTMFRLYVYLWRCQPPGADKMRRVRMYSSLCPAEYNEETLRMIDDDPQCQIVIATVVFANGINAKSILDSISLGFASTLDLMWQEKGRAGRDPDTVARGIVLVQPSTIQAALKQTIATSDTPTTAKQRTGKKAKSAAPMDLGKQLLLTEPECLIACMNRHYGNPPLETSTLDCILANRPFPCSLCASRCQDTVLVPCSRVSLPPLKFRSPPASHAIAPVKKNKLTRKERDLAKKELIAYRDHLRVREQNRGNFRNHPPSLFLPSNVQASLLDHLLSINSS